MQLTQLFSAATLAWTASALLVTPDTSDFATPEAQIEEAHRPTDRERILSNENQDGVIIRLPCDGCAVAQGVARDGGRTWDVSGKRMTDLLIALTYNKGNNIYFGGQPVHGSQAMDGVPVTAQVKALIDQDDFEVTTDILLMSIHVDISAGKPDEDYPDASSTDYRIEVLGIEDKVVHVPTVAFNVVENSDLMMLSNIEIVPTVTTMADAQCQNILCRIRAQIAAKMLAAMNAVKTTATKAKAGCMRMMGMHPHGNHGHHGHKHEHQQADAATNVVDRLHGGPNKFQGRPGHHGMKKPCGRHGFMARLAHGIMAVTRHVIIPVLIGVAAGMAVSALGMVVGQIVFMVWMRLRGRKQGGYIAVYQVEQVDDIEQAGEQLPKYEPADASMPPAYVDEKTMTEN